MDVIRILNRVHKIKGYVYASSKFGEWNGKTSIEVKVRAHVKSRPICSCCGEKGSGYDRLDARRFEFIPIWGLTVFLIYAMRRVNCHRCGSES